MTLEKKQMEELVTGWLHDGGSADRRERERPQGEETVGHPDLSYLK